VRAPAAEPRDEPLDGNTHPQVFPGANTMNSRQIRNRRVFRFESLEVRNAPSHFGALAHAAVALHKAPAAAHVRHFNDPQSTDKSPSQEKTGVDLSKDKGVETSSPDPSSNDPSSIDPKGDR
jgi:hypothetical protein